MWFLVALGYIVAAFVVQWLFDAITSLLGFAVMAPGLIGQAASERHPWLSAIFAGFNVLSFSVIGLALWALNVFLVILATAIVDSWLPGYTRTFWLLAAPWAGLARGWSAFFIVGLVAWGALG